MTPRRALESSKREMVGVAVQCTVCERTKKPVGRSAPMEAYLCDHECSGYYQDPKPGELWPGETREEFGY
jgi:hypothetical protein